MGCFSAGCESITGDILGKLGRAGQCGKDFTGRICRVQFFRQRKESGLDRLQISRDIIKYPVQTEQDRHLDQQLDAAACRIYAVFGIYFLGLSLLGGNGSFIRFSLILVLDLVELRLHLSLQLGEFLLLIGQGKHQNINQNGHDNDGKTYIWKSNHAQQLKDLIHDPSEQCRDGADDPSAVLG